MTNRSELRKENILRILSVQKVWERFKSSENLIYEEGCTDLIKYAEIAYNRWIYILKMLRVAIKGISSPRILELGALPYGLTSLMKLFTKTEIELFLTGAPYDKNRSVEEGEVVICNPLFGNYHCHLPLKLFNVEEDRFPYPNEDFHVVLCCEILEHLVHSPSRMFKEINRVLKPGGQLILTTPNIGSLRNIMALLSGRNIYWGLCKDDMYSRHNREYTWKEVDKLVTGSNFEVLELKFVSTFMKEHSRSWYYQGLIGFVRYLIVEAFYQVTSLPVMLFSSRRDIIVLRGLKRDEPVQYEPHWLYVRNNQIDSRKVT